MSEFRDLAEFYNLPDWFDTEEAGRMYGIYPNELYEGKIYGASATLGVAAALGEMPDTGDRIFEFGSGNGDGLIALNMLAESWGGAVVTGSEQNENRQKIAKTIARHLGHVATVEGDGLTVMHDNPDTYDLILANMFGRSFKGVQPELAYSFVEEAHRALKTGGIAVIKSDPQTMWHVRDVATETLDPDHVVTIKSDNLPPAIDVWPHLVLRK